MVKKIVLLFTLVVCFAGFQASAIAQVQTAKDVYLINLQKKVQANWLTPQNSEGKSAVVAFTVNSDGSFSEIDILRSSSDKNFDTSAVNAINKAGLYAPVEIADAPLKVEFFFSPLFTSYTVDSVVDPNIVNVANTTQDADFSAYTVDLQNKVNSNWNPGKFKKVKETIAYIKVDKDGSLSDFGIIKSSRNKKYDRAILDTIAKSVPMEALPDGLGVDSTNVQLTFNCVREKGKLGYVHNVNASIKNIKGAEAYTEQVDAIIAAALKGKRYYHHKDVVLELVINKTGKLKYVKMQKSSKDKNFDRKILATVQKASFPQIPSELGMDSIKFNYEIVTQRGYSFHDFVCDYVLSLGTKGLKAFSL